MAGNHDDQREPIPGWRHLAPYADFLIQAFQDQVGLSEALEACAEEYTRAMNIFDHQGLRDCTCECFMEKNAMSVATQTISSSDSVSTQTPSQRFRDQATNTPAAPRQLSKLTQTPNSDRPHQPMMYHAGTQTPLPFLPKFPGTPTHKSKATQTPAPDCSPTPMTYDAGTQTITFPLPLLDIPIPAPRNSQFTNPFMPQYRPTPTFTVPTVPKNPKPLININPFRIDAETSGAEHFDLPPGPSSSNAPAGCWNCDDLAHSFRECSKQLATFCYRCGKPGVTIKRCVNCYQQWRQEGPYRPKKED